MQTSRAQLLTIISLIGFGSLVYQIYSMRVLFMYFVQSAQAASIAVSAFLGGLAFSSIIFSRVTSKNSRNLRIIYWLQLGSAFYGYFLLSRYDLIPSFIDGLSTFDISGVYLEVMRTSIIWGFLFIPAFFLGGAFPLINGLYLSNLENSSKDTGTVYFYDTFGAIIGALLTGYLFIPYLGLQYTILIPVILSLCVCLLACRSRLSDIMTFIVLVALCSVELYSFTNKSDLVSRYYSRFGEIIFQEESPFGQVTIGERGMERTLYINFREMCLSDFEYNRSEISLGMIAANVIKPNAQVANIGLGCGFTADQLVQHDHVLELDIVEINPTVLEATSKHLKAKNNDVTERPGVTVILREGYEYLRNVDKKYDAIVVDIEEASIIHSSALYTKEFFEVVNERLNDDGVFALWSFTMNEKFTEIIYNTLLEVFPYVKIQHNGGSNNFFAARDVAVAVRLEKYHSAKYMTTLFLEDNNQINTISEPNIEKYFDINKLFGFPAEYVDEFAITKIQAENNGR